MGQAASLDGGPNPTAEPLRHPIEPTGAITGMRMMFEVKGLDFLDSASANKRNPEPPHFCGLPAKNGDVYNVWVQDTDKDMGRQAEEVTFWTGNGGPGAMASVAEAAGGEPAGCKNARLWSASLPMAPTAVAACDGGENCGLIPPKGAWPLTASARLIADDPSPEAETFADYDILEADAAKDADWLYLTLKVRGQASQGSSNPIQAHLYGFLLMDPKLGDKVQAGKPQGFMVHYMYHYRMANQKEAVLIRMRNDKTKMPDTDIAAIAQGDVVLFKIRKKAVGLKPGNPLKAIGFTAEVPRLGPVTEVDVKDVTTIGLIQDF